MSFRTFVELTDCTWPSGRATGWSFRFADQDSATSAPSMVTTYLQNTRGHVICADIDIALELEDPFLRCRG